MMRLTVLENLMDGKDFSNMAYAPPIHYEHRQIVIVVTMEVMLEHVSSKHKYISINLIKQNRNEQNGQHTPEV